MTIQEAQQKVDQWIRTTGVRYFSELTNMAILTEEVGEVARLMSRIYGDQSFKESDKNKELSDELADVLWVLICIANQTGVDRAGVSDVDRLLRDRVRLVALFSPEHGFRGAADPGAVCDSASSPSSARRPTTRSRRQTTTSRRTCGGSRKWKTRSPCTRCSPAWISPA